MQRCKKIEKELFHISYRNARNQEGLGMNGFLEAIVT